MIRLTAKHRKRKTSLPVAVFISSYVTHLTFFVAICGFIAESNHSAVNITIVLTYFVEDYSRLMNTCPIADATPKDKIPARSSMWATS